MSFKVSVVFFSMESLNAVPVLSKLERDWLYTSFVNGSLTQKLHQNSLTIWRLASHIAIAAIRSILEAISSDGNITVSLAIIRLVAASCRKYHHIIICQSLVTMTTS